MIPANSRKLIAKNIVPSQLPGFSAAPSAANANEGVATTAAIAINPALLVNSMYLTTVGSIDIVPRLRCAPPRKPLRAAFARFAPHVTDLLLCTQSVGHLSSMRGRPGIH